MFGRVGLLFDSSQTGSRSTADGCPYVPMGLIGGHQDISVVLHPNLLEVGQEIVNVGHL
jgi:hypothetical protein